MTGKNQAEAILLSGLLAQQLAPTITAADIKEADEAASEFAKITKLRNAAEKRLNKALSTVFEKAVGVNSLDEVKAMPLTEIKKSLLKRVEMGFVKVEVPFSIEDTHVTTSIAYKEELINAKGQAYVMGLEGKKTHSYRIIQG